MNREIIAMYYYYKSGKLEKLVQSSIDEMNNNQFNKKVINQLNMRHISEIELPPGLEYMIHRLICKKIFEGKTGEDLKLNHNEILEILQGTEVVMFDNYFKKVLSNTNSIVNKNDVYEIVNEIRENIKGEMTEYKKEVKIKKKNHSKEEYINYFLSVILKHSLDIINELLPYERHGLPTLNIISYVMNLLLTKNEELIFEIEGLIPCRILDQYGLEDKLIIQSLYKKIDYLTSKMESIGMNLEEEMYKDNFKDNLDCIDNLLKVRSVINKKEHLFIKYDPDLYLAREKKLESKDDKNNNNREELILAKRLRNELPKMILKRRKDDKEIYGVDVNSVLFNTHLNNIDVIFKYINGEIEIDETEFYKIRSEIVNYTGIDEKLKY